MGKHVEQFTEENHLRWDSSGEYLALAESIEALYSNNGNKKAKVLAAALNVAIEKFLDANKNPGRKVKELDNRAAHFFLCMYWAEALGAQNTDASLKAKFAGIAKDLESKEKKICQDLIDCQGAPCDIGGYYKPDTAKLTKLMNPSTTFNEIVSNMTVKKAASKPTGGAAAPAPAGTPVTHLAALAIGLVIGYALAKRA